MDADLHTSHELSGRGLRHILMVGERFHREFTHATSWLTRHSRLTCCDSVPEALHHLAGGELPHMIILAQARPGQFTRADLELLCRLAPLARPVALLGSWCEGEPRTGHPLPGVVRVYWHEFETRFARELSQPAAGIWTLPRTATEAERSLHLDVPQSIDRREMVAVAATTISVYKGIAEACAQSGHASVWFGPRNTPTVTRVLAGIWDASNAAFGNRIGPAPLIVLAGFPRLTDRQQLEAIGVRSVIAKPYLVPDLLTALEQCAAQRERQAA